MENYQASNFPFAVAAIDSSLLLSSHTRTDKGGGFFQYFMFYELKGHRPRKAQNWAFAKWTQNIWEADHPAVFLRF